MNTIQRFFVIFTIFSVTCCIFSAKSQDTLNANATRFNQVGFYPKGPKIAIVLTTKASEFTVITLPGKAEVFKGTLVQSDNTALNEKKTYIANFSPLHAEGKFSLVVAGLGSSRPFLIEKDIYQNVAKASVKGYYYQRASTALPVKFAGKWHREEGHPDNKVLIHSSAATDARPAGTIISAPGGWYDAGDYNKYIVNSGVTMGTLISLCEDFPEYIKKVNLNIPESGNNVPDVLNEILYNLRWMLKMQDPNDGGVYNKLTNSTFDGMVMPNAGRSTRYVVQKGTAATLDFAAVMAKASRTVKRYSKELPGLGDSCLRASVKAWDWAQKNPKIIYDQNAMNRQFDPKIATGSYGDRDFNDEFIWAATELFITTGDKNYYASVNLFPDDYMPLPSWGNVRLLGYYALLTNEKTLFPFVKNDIAILKKRLIKMADSLIAGVNSRAYQTVMGKSKRDFGWGSNSIAANQGVALIQAYRIKADKKYLDYALSNLDYLLGRNATGYCYLTGFGYKSPMHPHHRQSVADGIDEPVPGLLVGGPNPGVQDGIKPVSTIPDEAYIDDSRAYAVNEIAINWNAPFVYLTNAIEALRVKATYTDN